MKVGVEAGYGMNLTYRNANFFRKLLELLGRQVAEIFLNGSQFIKHNVRDSALDCVEPSLRS